MPNGQIFLHFSLQRQISVCHGRRKTPDFQYFEIEFFRQMVKVEPINGQEILKSNIFKNKSFSLVEKFYFIFFSDYPCKFQPLCLSDRLQKPGASGNRMKLYADVAAKPHFRRKLEQKAQTKRSLILYG